MTNFLSIDQIEFIELGITSLCNAGCPLCSRHVTGTSTTVPGFVKESMQLAQIQKLSTELKDYTHKIKLGVCGTFGDPMMHPEIEQIIECTVPIYKEVACDTNGGMRDTGFWSRLGKISADNNHKLLVMFSIDGLEDTNHLYRINTDYAKIIDNAKAYIDAGGFAIWKFIIFEHNQHQVETARELSKQMGFANFVTIHSKRFTLETEQIDKSAYRAKINKDESVKQKGFELKPSDKAKNSDLLLHNVNKVTENILPDIQCKSIEKNYIYISEDSKLWPCCYFEANKYGGSWPIYWHSVEEKYGKNFNSLIDKSLSELLNHEYFAQYLPSSWTDSDTVCNTCVRKCGKINGTTYYKERSR
jgi:hypothetical protein